MGGHTVRVYSRVLRIECSFVTSSDRSNLRCLVVLRAGEIQRLDLTTIAH
jgi:hypothetical protein